jgi:hypothetical protein
MDHEKFVKIATQELRHLQSTSSGFADELVVPLMIGTIIIGVLLAAWIFRGGLSRFGRSMYATRRSIGDSETLM